MTEELENIRSRITELSGSGKRVAPGSRKHGIYSTFTLPGLTDMVAVRDTVTRFSDFGVPNTLDGASVIDLGCNVGATVFEFSRRGASVTGVEFREDRVELCRAIAKRWALDAEFHQADFNCLDSEPSWYKKHDVVWCSSVDEYITDLQPFYSMLLDLCGGVLYLESNLQGIGLSDPENVLAMLEHTGFATFRYLGNGHSGGISRKRKLYVATV